MPQNILCNNNLNTSHNSFILMNDTNTNDKLSQAFINGLAEMGYDYLDVKANWKYYGGNRGSHLNYYHTVTNDPLPEKHTRCVCNHAIMENCYICDPTEETIIIIGNCCIKKFIDKRGRTCANCGSSHRNIKDNFCGPCRKLNKCSICKTLHSNKDTLCNICRNLKKCRGCTTMYDKKHTYPYCNYKCYLKNK